MDGCKYHTQGWGVGWEINESSAGMRKGAGLFFKARARKGF